MPLVLLALACLQRDTFPDLAPKETGTVDSAIPPVDTAEPDTGPTPPATVLVPTQLRAWSCDWCSGVCDLDAKPELRWCPCMAWRTRNT